MRVLLVTHAYPPAGGGVPVLTRELAWGLASAGDEVHVLAREADPARPECSRRLAWDTAPPGREGARVRLHWVNHQGLLAADHRDGHRALRLQPLLCELIDEVRPEVAHVQHLTGLSLDLPELLAARGVRVLLTLHDFWLQCQRGQLLNTDYAVCPGPTEAGCARCLSIQGTGAPVSEALGPEWPSLERARELVRARDADARRACAHVERFFCASADARRRFLDWGLPPERVHHLPYGHAPRPRPERQPRTRPLRIGFLGSLLQSKGPDLAVRAVGRLPTGAARLEIWGGLAPHYHFDVRYADALPHLLAQGHVRYHGPASREEVARALPELDVLVVPSIWPETGPLVVGEAFLAGVPCVVSDLGGTAELVREGVGGLQFRAGDAADLERVLRRLLDEPELLDELRASIPAVGTLADRLEVVRRHYAELVVAPRPPLRVAAVVVDCGTPRETAGAVEALWAGARRPDQVVVVDNGGGAGPRLRELLGDKAEVLSAGENLGFGGGANLGARHALERGAQRLLFVNSDAVLAPDALARLEAEAEARGAGLAGPAITSGGKVESLGIDFEPRSGRARLHHHGTDPSLLEGLETQAVDALSGCVLWVRADVLTRLEGFADAFFFGYEDIDLSLRARSAGYSLIAVPSARVEHAGATTIGPRSPARLYYAARNHLLLGKRLGRDPARQLSIAALTFANALSGRSGVSRRAGLRAAWAGVRDHLQGRYGALSGDQDTLTS